MTAILSFEHVRERERERETLEYITKRYDYPKRDWHPMVSYASPSITLRMAWRLVCRLVINGRLDERLAAFDRVRQLKYCNSR